MSAWRARSATSRCSSWAITARSWSGETVPQAFERLYFFERACQAQVLALSTGRALKLVPEKVVRATVAQFESGGQVGGRDRADLHFEALKRMLDRNHADYAS